MPLPKKAGFRLIAKQDESKPLMSENDKSIFLNDLPRIYVQLRNSNELAQLKKLLALASLRAQITSPHTQSESYYELIKSLLDQSNHGGGESMLNTITASTELVRITDNAMRLLVLLAELSNAMAYNKANLSLRLDLAYEDSLFSIKLMHYLLNCFRFSSETKIINDLKHKIASYYDTLQWIFYQTNNLYAKETMQVQETLLLEAEALGQLALQYNPTWSIIHYHLARIHMTQIDMLWQAQSKKDAVQLAKLAPMIRRHIIKASEHWEMALNNDQVNRLSTQLDWLLSRINEYRKVWDTLQIDSFRALSVTDKGK